MSNSSKPEENFDYIKQQVIAMLGAYGSSITTDLLNSDPESTVTPANANADINEIITSVGNANDVVQLNSIIQNSGLTSGSIGELKAITSGNAIFHDGWTNEPLPGMPAGFGPGSGSYSTSDGSGALDTSTESMLRQTQDGSGGTPTSSFIDVLVPPKSPNPAFVSPTSVGAGAVLTNTAPTDTRDESDRDKAAAVQAAKKIISDEQSQGIDINGDGKVGHIKLANFEKRDVKGAFDKKQEALQTAIQQDGPGSSALSEYNQSVTDEANIKKEIVAVETKIKENKTPGAWAGVPGSVARAEQADLNAQLQQEKTKVQEFGVAVAGMTPTEREDLNKFFQMAKEDPEGTKKFVQSTQAKEKHVALIDEQIKANTVASFGNAVPKGVAQAEQRDTNAQLQQQKVIVAAAPLNPDVNPSFVSSMNPTGSIQKDKELKAFFAKVEADKKVAAQAQANADKQEQQWLAQKKATTSKKTSGGTTNTSNSPLPVPPPKPASTVKLKYM